jgi:hypothetical protein
MFDFQSGIYLMRTALMLGCCIFGKVALERVTGHHKVYVTIQCMIYNMTDRS